jgi:hypothetical protein
MLFRAHYVHVTFKNQSKQAKISNMYRNVDVRVLKTNAAMWFNNICKTPLTAVVFKAYLLTYLLHGAESFLRS